MDGNSPTKRIAALDHLRVAACFMVMAIHSCEPFYLGGEAPNVTSVASRWDMLWITLTECLCRACVPLFVMTSSYLLFPVRRPTGEFLKRRLSRVFVPFAFWAAVYVAWGGGVGDWGRLCFNFPDAGGHLWFVPMLFGLYLLMPLLSPWAEKVTRRELDLWILLWLFTTSFPFLRMLWSALYGEPPFGAVPYLWGECPWNQFGAFHYVSGFFGYVLLGLRFRKFAHDRTWRKTLCIAVPEWIAGAALMGVPFFMSVRHFPFASPYQTAVVMERSIEYCSTGVALTTVATFLVFLKFDFCGLLYRKAVRPIAEASYGMYLIHMLFLPIVFGALRPHLPTPLTIVASAATTFALSAATATVMRKMPFLRRLV